MIFREFRKNTSEPQPVERILPSDVRYALQYKGAQFGTEEIKALAMNGYEREASYVALKALQRNPEAQQATLQNIVSLVRTSSERQAALREVILKAVSEKDLFDVNGAKIAQLSRQGIETWHAKYEKLAQDLAQRSEPVFLVGYATLIGLEDFVREFQKVGKDFYVLRPESFNSEEEMSCGYLVSSTGGVQSLPRDFSRPVDAVIVDDVKNTGAAEKAVADFWGANPTHASPTFVYLDEPRKGE